MNLRLPRIASASGGEVRLTGRSVLVMLLAFFGVVMVVNVFMVQAAISTFGGVDTPSSYEAGLAFKAEEAAAAAQNARDWHVAVAVVAVDSGIRVEIDAKDEGGHPITGATVAAKLAHPVDERLDVVVELKESTPGQYSGIAQAEPGQRNLDVEIDREGKRLFRSINRVTVP